MFLSSDGTICTNNTKQTSNSSSSKMSETVQSSQTATRVVLCAGIILAFSSAVMSMSSPQSAFSIINQFQLLILLPLIGTYLPDDIVLFLSGMDFTLFSFSFIPIDKLLSFADSNPESSYLEQIGLKYKSSLLNNISLGISILAFVVIHI